MFVVLFSPRCPISMLWIETHAMSWTKARVHPLTGEPTRINQIHIMSQGSRGTWWDSCMVLCWMHVSFVWPGCGCLWLSVSLRPATVPAVSLKDALIGQALTPFFLGSALFLHDFNVLCAVSYELLCAVQRRRSTVTGISCHIQSLHASHRTSYSSLLSGFCIHARHVSLSCFFWSPFSSSFPLYGD